MKRFKPWVQILGIGLLLLSLQLISIFAASGTKLYLNPASQTIQPGQSFTVAVRISTSNSLLYTGYVKAYLDFPADKLSVTKVDTSTNSYQSRMDQSYDNSSGTIHIEQQNPNTYSPDQFIANITFKAIKSGTASVTFSPSSKVSDQPKDSNNLSGSDGGTYIIPGSDPVPTPKSSAPKTSNTGQTTSVVTQNSPSTPASTGDLSIDNIKTTVSYDHVTLSWQTNAATSANIFYGTDSQQLDKTLAIKTKQTNSSINIPQLSPGQRYYYTIQATDAKGRQASRDGDFTALGYPVQITVIRSDKKSAIDAQVFINGNNLKANGIGQVATNLPAGSFSAAVAAGKIKNNFTVNVVPVPLPTDGSDPEGQSFTLELKPGPAFTWTELLGIGILITLLAVFGAGVWLMVRARARRATEPYLDDTDRPAVIETVARFGIKVPDNSESEVAIESHQIHHNFSKARSSPKLDSLHPHDEAPTIQPLNHSANEAPAQKSPKATEEQSVEPPKSKPVAQDEPKDMFETAEERFEQDDRLKNLRR